MALGFYRASAGAEVVFACWDCRLLDGGLSDRELSSVATRA